MNPVILRIPPYSCKMNEIFKNRTFVNTCKRGSNYAKAVADLVKEVGGMPFLTDCNTLYPGSRKNALEQACVDACQKTTPIRNSQLGDNLADPEWHHHHDHFRDSNPNVRWRETLAHAEKIGLGTRDYELIVM